MNKQYRVGVIGATGMVGQRFITLLASHPTFNLSVVAASERSAGKTYEDAVQGRWLIPGTIPEQAKSLRVYDAVADLNQVAESADIIFSAVEMQKDEIFALEEQYAKAEVALISNNSAHRWTPDIPMVIPELNCGHIAVIESQRKRLGTKRGFIAVKSNCSIQSYVPALYPISEQYPIESILACTYQSISGAGKTLETAPEIVDNIIPYIGGEEEKSEREPLKIWGQIEGGVIVTATEPSITAQCIRVPVSNGHLAAVFVRFKNAKPTKEQLIDSWENFVNPISKHNLPSAPKKFLYYFTEDNRPQTKLDRDLENGMAVSIGRLREDTQYDYKFVCLSHNTLRGAAGGAVELAELLCAENYI